MVVADKIAPWKRKVPATSFDVKLMALVPGNITMQMGTQAISDGVVAEADLYDLLYIPGGIGSGQASLDPVGARVEYVDIADRGPIEQWVRTGRFPGGIGQS